MRILVHISDMHFGKIDPACIEPMLTAFQAINPNLIIISGDFTQRAQISEYKDAAAFLKSLEHPHLVIPGNHDIRPLFNPLSRLSHPFDRYKQYISDNLEPGYVDDEIAVASVNTVRAHAIKDGRVNKTQIDRLARWFKRVSDNKLKIVVTHHPFDMPMVYKTETKEYNYKSYRLAKRAKMAVHTLATAGIDMYFSGHYHQSSAGETTHRYKIENYSAISVRAGTVSLRQRGEQQSFNLIFTEPNTVRVDTYVYDIKKKIFALCASRIFVKTGKQWRENKKLEREEHLIA
jgi:3',5'-cyclic AMP phosphodiesterase CpdA